MEKKEGIVNMFYIMSYFGTLEGVCWIVLLLYTMAKCEQIHSCAMVCRVRISRSQFAICEPIFRICELQSLTTAYFSESILSHVEQGKVLHASTILWKHQFITTGRHAHLFYWSFNLCFRDTLFFHCWVLFNTSYYFCLN